MKTTSIITVAIFTSSVAAMHGQGTITFNGSPNFSGTNYHESGMQFGLVVPTLGEPDHDGMATVSSPASNVPSNSTPYMVFFQQLSPDNYISFNLTNGYSFGLTSVQLADPNSPSSSLEPIAFIGFLANGSSVTNTFTTPGGGATTFQNYTFTSAFASGLTSVDIFAPRWAMDNLVFGNVDPVPEPGVESLIAMGLLALIGRTVQARRKL